MSTKDLLTSIDKFLSGEDTSLRAANEIEIMIEDEFPDEDFFQETVEMLACYHPDGGDYLLDTETIKGRLVKTKERILINS